MGLLPAYGAPGKRYNLYYHMWESKGAYNSLDHSFDSDTGVVGYGLIIPKPHPELDRNSTLGHTLARSSFSLVGTARVGMPRQWDDR